MLVSAASEIDGLLAVSGRVGADPMLVQAATGNTSIKLDDVLWIKASGKWLAHAGQDEILVPVSLPETLRRISNNADPAGQSAVVAGKSLGTSVETAMHAVIPQRVVLHVHSVNTITWAVREDGEALLTERMKGLEWKWIPYTPSGLRLAAAISEALAANPATRVFVLANHGLVVCEESCEAAEELLRDVERRVASAPRPVPEPDWAELETIAERIGWRVPVNPAVHTLGIDQQSLRILRGGVLYPCQAIFLAAKAPIVSEFVTASDVAEVEGAYLVVEGRGVLMRQRQNPVEGLTLAGLVQVLLRLPDDAPPAYLSEGEVKELLCADVYHYRARVEGNGSNRMPFHNPAGPNEAGSLELR